MKRIAIIFLVCIALVVRVSAQKTYRLRDFGVVPNSKANSTPLLKNALEQIRNRANGQAVVILFEKGRYDFHPEGATIREYYVSNHDQVNPKTVGIALESFNNVTLLGKNTDLVFHGRMLPLAIIESEKVTIKNLDIDFDKPQIAQVTILENNPAKGQILYQTAPWVSYKIKDSTFFNLGEGWENQPTSGIAFENATKHIVYKSGDLRVGTKHVTEIAQGKILADKWVNKSLIPGTVVALRSWARPAPGIFLHKDKDVVLKNVKVHYAEGMGLLAQLTENIYMDGFGVCLRGQKDPRYFTTQADATHFSGCKGIIVSKNGLYEGMMDDAINVHGTYLKLTKRINDYTLVGRYMHGQSYGFDWGYVADTVQFIKSATMDLLPEKNTISAIESLPAKGGVKEFKITFKQALPNNLHPETTDFGIENLTLTPSVIFTGNTIRNNRARGALFSTPKTTLVSHNVFDHTSGSAIVLCGDSNGWYETGSCRDITIRNNKFINALTSMFQFTSAVISIYPEIPDLKHQQHYFHSGIKIEDNLFDTFDIPLVYAKSVDGITITGNQIKTNTDYPAYHRNKKRVKFDRVINYQVFGNKVNGQMVDLMK